MQPALQERPEIFKTVCVDLAVNILHRMVYNAALEFSQTVIRFQSIAIDSRARFNMLAYFSLNRFLLTVWDYGSADAAGFAVLTAFQNTHDGGFILASGACDLGLPHVAMHVPGFATDERFVGFNFAG
jgi:hypothetical protein